jgi:hypothetical protein
MLTPPALRFGRIHILSPEFLQQMKKPENSIDTRTNCQRMEAALKDEPASEGNPWHHFTLWDGRKVILTNTDTHDATRFQQYQNAHSNKAFGGPREKRLIDEFITENHDQRIYFDA